MNILLDIYKRNELTHRNVTVSQTARLLDTNTRNIYKSLKEGYNVSGHRLVVNNAEAREHLALINDALNSVHKERMLSVLKAVSAKIKTFGDLEPVRINMEMIEDKPKVIEEPYQTLTEEEPAEEYFGEDE